MYLTDAFVTLGGKVEERVEIVTVLNDSENTGETRSKPSSGESAGATVSRPARNTSKGNIMLHPEHRLLELEKNFHDYAQQISSLDVMFNNQISELQNQFGDLEHVLNTVLERINAG